MLKDIIELGKKLGYKVRKEENCDPEDVINNCFVAGNEIFIGKYENEEYLLISFFHEHGHRLVSQDFIKKVDYNTLIIEIEAWNLGIKSAMELGYIFSDDAIAWAYREKALSYAGHDERECSNWAERVKPMLWKNRTHKNLRYEK